MKKITIGARGSKLSKAYVDRVKNLILENFKDINIVIKFIKTTGDIHENKKISEIGGKNLFCKEIEENLVNKEIDMAIHSLKDMESDEHKDLVIGAFVKRNDPRDILISKKLKKISDLNRNIVIGSSSKRREFQLKKINKNILIKNIRGNVDTRIKKLEENNLDAIILAAAGVKSLNLEKKISIYFSVNEILPAVGQGIIALQCRNNDSKMIDIAKKINDEETSWCALAERMLLKTIGGNCETAVGAFAEIKNNKLNLKAQLFSDDGRYCFNSKFSGQSSDAINIGKIAGENLLNLAGGKFKKK